MAKTFLTAEWRKLIILNYKIDQKLIEPFIPFKTEIDLWENSCYVSLLGFMFLNTKIKGFKIPFHSDFEEVNLRFYVKHKDNKSKEWRRGVVFIKEIVPKPAIVLIANTIYNENYETMKMEHEWKISEDTIEAEYKWKKDEWNKIKVIAAPDAKNIEAGSEAEFITAHYWGYTKLKNNKTSEYEVGHPGWKMYEVLNYEVDVDFEKIYGHEFGFLKDEKPVSVYFAEGSEILVNEGRKI